MRQTHLADLIAVSMRQEVWVVVDPRALTDDLVMQSLISQMAIEAQVPVEPLVMACVPQRQPLLIMAGSIMMITVAHACRPQHEETLRQEGGAEPLHQDSGTVPSCHFFWFLFLVPF